MMDVARQRERMKLLREKSIKKVRASKSANEGLFDITDSSHKFKWPGSLVAGELIQD
jgi:hypothetical protein